MIIYDKNEKIKAGKIIDEALAEALSVNSARTYIEIWVDMLGKIIELREAGSVTRWEKEKPELQDKVGESAGFSFKEFVESIAKIENTICRVLALHGEQQTLN